MFDKKEVINIHDQKVNEYHELTERINYMKSMLPHLSLERQDAYIDGIAMYTKLRAAIYNDLNERKKDIHNLQVIYHKDKIVFIKDGIEEQRLYPKEIIEQRRYQNEIGKSDS